MTSNTGTQKQGKSDGLQGKVEKINLSLSKCILMTVRSRRGEWHISLRSKGDKAGVIQHLGRKAGSAIVHPISHSHKQMGHVI